MATLKAFDRVRDTTTTTGTGTVTVAGSAPTGYQTLAGAGLVAGDLFPCVMSGQGTAEWEDSIATMVTGTTFNRSVVLGSSNAGALVNFSAGTKDVFIDNISKIVGLQAGLDSGQRLRGLQFSDFIQTVAPHGPYTQTLISAGTSAASATGIPTTSHPGCWSIASSTTANSGGALTTALAQMLLGGGEQFDCVFKTPAAFTSITTRLGFLDTITTADAVDGCYIEIPATGVAVGKTSSNSVRTTSATIATLAVNTWYHGRVKLNAAATGVDITIFDDTGTQLGTVNITTNIPTGAGRETGAGYNVTNAGTVATLSGIIDYMSFGQAPNLRDLIRGSLT